MPRRMLFLSGAVLTILLLPRTATAQCLAGEIAVAADRDNTLYEDVAGALSNGSGEWIFAGSTGLARRRALVRFDVAGTIPAGSSVTGATVWLTLSRTNTGVEDVSLHPVLADWGEGTSDAGAPGGTGAASTAGDATWIHTYFATSFWTAVGGDFGPASATSAVGALGAHSWSSPAVVADVQGWLDAPATNHGWIVIGNEAATRTAQRFDARESLGGAPPRLCIAVAPSSAVDIPTLGTTALVVLALALAGLAVRRSS